ncbi:hypothetical protein S40293_03844 [Stachybotrys chartarum IBT 40293]|nr:hypothetical protein S40293_03844 [Stachybotrys chartarum IBT 40293]
MRAHDDSPASLQGSIHIAASASHSSSTSEPIAAAPASASASASASATDCSSRPHRPQLSSAAADESRFPPPPPRTPSTSVPRPSLHRHHTAHPHPTSSFPGTARRCLPGSSNSGTGSPGRLLGSSSNPYRAPILGLVDDEFHPKRMQQATKDCTMERSPIKKARTGASPPRKVDMPPPTTGGFAPPPTGGSQHKNPQSPLFFSHSPKHLARPVGYPTADPSVSMLSRLRENAAGDVTTVKLPRASIRSPNHGMSGSTPGSGASSSDMVTTSHNVDSRSSAPGLPVLHGIGVIELLEQDQRPTFLVDLANPDNPAKPGLHIIYYNTSLRGSRDTLHLLSPEQDGSGPDTEFDHFKSWLLTPARSPEGLDTALASYSYGGISWTCLTLRRRFRFISGSTSTGSVGRDTAAPPAFDQDAQHGPLEGDDEDRPEFMPASPVADPGEPADYFAEPSRKASRDEEASGNVEVAMTDDGIRCHPDEFTNQVLLSRPMKATFDWTRIPMSDSLPEHIKFAKSIDWAATPLGPIEDWPAELRTMSNLIMGSPHPAAMYWGPDLICIYNAAYIELAGQKHPSLMGQRYMDAWSEIWEEIRPVFESAIESGQATMKHENHLFIARSGFLEETFFSWSIVPLLNSDGEVVGLYNPAFENTRRRVNERRMFTLRELGERTAAATTVSGFWPQVQRGLEYNDLDVPFALIYSVKDDNESEVSSLHSGSLAHPPQLALEGAVGCPDESLHAFSHIDLRTSDEGFAPYLRQSMSNGGAPVILSEDAGNLPSNLLEGLNWRGFGEPSRTLVVFPIIPTTTSEAVAGFIVMGVNPRRPYDDDYQLFIHLLSRQLATSMASVVLFEEEIKRGQRAARLAALDRQELSMQLILRTQEANESEYRFTRMAAFAPVGMFIANSEGRINYCNDMWWQISRHLRSEENMNVWMNGVNDEDRPALEAAWQKLLVEKVTVSVEFRFKHAQRSGDNNIDTWVLMSAFPEKSAEGSLTSIFGCITDISSQKWAEKVQSERREEAVELKRQQENFIDITSHEMRNPLSAILQCADQIVNSISAYATNKEKEHLETMLEGCLDAANTINLCASHQKRIVDDILTLSKLDSNLLAVTPVDEQPVRVVQRALKMFESELIAHDIEFEFHVDDTFDKYGIKWAKLDPSRLRQILINLMTNAIKFTQGREKRSISVSLSASKDITEVTRKGTIYFPRNNISRKNGMDVENVDDWGRGERINIHCSVEDTGPGLGEEELKLLFQRFQQATPRTHVQYGGSGLGLFISRILTEMQGGQIGVSSARGSGSKFHFYIQSRASLNPPADYEHISPFKIARKAMTPTTPTEPQPITRAPSARGPPSTPGTRPLFDVLIVEDNIVNQKVLQRQLRNCGNNTFVANHGMEALQTLQQSRFWLGREAEGVDISVILMDLEMPVMDGMTCARRIRELEREGTIVKHIPIIAVTAYARPEQIANAKAAGIDDVISKPFRIPELIPKIEELVSKYQNLSVSASSE